MKRLVQTLLFTLVVVVFAMAADKPAIIMDWPASGMRVLHLEMSKFNQIGGIGKQRTYTVEVTSQNVWGKAIDNIAFEVYLFDKNTTRIAQSYLTIGNLATGQKTVQTLTFTAVGTPETLSLSPAVLPKELGPPAVPKTISVQLNSTPSGADIKIDGEAAGTTPKAVRLAVGHHMLEFSRVGFRNVQYPFDISADDLNGGRLDIELGTVAHDTLELRDGSVITGDILTMDADNIVVRVAGQDQSILRNRVKRVLLVERLPAQP